MASDDLTSCRNSVQCVDDPTPQYPVVAVYGDETFQISVPQYQDASGEGQGTYSSVRPFQSAHYDTEDQASHDSLETDRNSLPSLQEGEEEREKI